MANFVNNFLLVLWFQNLISKFEAFSPAHWFLNAIGRRRDAVLSSRDIRNQTRKWEEKIIIVNKAIFESLPLFKTSQLELRDCRRRTAKVRPQSAIWKEIARFFYGVLPSKLTFDNLHLYRLLSKVNVTLESHREPSSSFINYVDVYNVHCICKLLPINVCIICKLQKLVVFKTVQDLQLHRRAFEDHCRRFGCYSVGIRTWKFSIGGTFVTIGTVGIVACNFSMESGLLIFEANNLYE